jgi:hypothetical protein
MKKNFQMTDIPVAQPAPREERSYLHTRGAGVAVPFMQSVVTAFIVAALFGVAFWAFGLRRMEKVTVLIFVIALAWDWFNHRRHWFGLTAVLENIVNRDLDGDKVIGEPQTIRIQVDKIESGRVHVTSLYDLPVDARRFKTLCEGLVADPPLPFSERQWAGKGKSFSGPEWRKLQAEMKRRELIVLRDASAPKQGYILTPAGVAMALKVAASPTPEA